MRDSSRASTSEAALSQAASEMSALNHALSRYGNMVLLSTPMRRTDPFTVCSSPSALAATMPWVGLKVGALSLACQEISCARDASHALRGVNPIAGGQLRNFPPVRNPQTIDVSTIQRRAREEVTSKESEAAKAAEGTNRLRLQLGQEQQKVTDAEVSQKTRI